MVVVLTPVPNAGTAGLTAARAYLQANARTGTDDRTDHLMALASALVEREASNAPQAVKNEAVLRFCGYLAESRFGAVRSTDLAGVLPREYVVNHSAMFRNCGAAGLLSRWKIRRAGVIG